MKTLISKELLSEVLQKEVVKVKEIENTTLIYGCAVHDGWYDEINIYEFAHKCKEWAFSKCFIIEVGVHPVIKKDRQDRDFFYTLKTKEGSLIFTVDCKTIIKSEPEAIFKACEWIRTNR